MARRYVRGDRAFGRILKRLPQEVTDELRTQLNATGRTLLAAEERRAPMRTGAVRAALSFAVTPVRLRLKVGLIGKALNRKLFYAWFDEWGRKGGGRGVKRKSAKYNRGVGALPSRHFVFLAGVRDQIYPAFRNIWDHALTKAGSGASDD